jgi:Uma2 family endonuclease
MNAPTRMDQEPRRRLFTVDEVLAMQHAGVFEDGEDFELIEGELILMQSKNNPHELYKNNLAQMFYRLLPKEATAWVEPTLYLPPYNAPDPDIMVFPRGVSINDLKPEQVFLVVEVAETTLRTDLGVKAALYARFRLREYWVVDASAPRILVHRSPGADGWGEVREVGRDETVSPLAFPQIVVCLADLER